MRVRAAVSLVLVSALLGACTGSHTRDLARYYDPQGLFSTDLPAANDLSLAQPQPQPGAESILSGVTASPPQPSASPSSALDTGLGAGIGQTSQTDQTIYQVLAVGTRSFASLDAMTLAFLTSDPSIDVRDEEAIEMAGSAGRLVVVDIHQSGSVAASLAAAFTLGSRGVGYIVAAVFAPGAWASERGDFGRIVGSLRADVPPGVETFPLTTG
jgi:hypothetical protein